MKGREKKPHTGTELNRGKGEMGGKGRKKRKTGGGGKKWFSLWGLGEGKKGHSAFLSKKRYQLFSMFFFFVFVVVDKNRLSIQHWVFILLAQKKR